MKEKYRRERKSGSFWTVMAFPGIRLLLFLWYTDDVGFLCVKSNVFLFVCLDRKKLHNSNMEEKGVD